VQKSVIAGSLSAVAGSLALVGGLLLILIGIAYPSIVASEETHGSSVNFGTGMWLVLGILGMIFGILAIVSGIFAIQRKKWGLALTGAIASCLVFLPLGVACVILVAMDRPAFIQNESVTSSQNHFRVTN